MADAAIPLLLDTDIGDDVDDVFALLLAAREPRLQLLGVTTVYGDVAQRTRIARKLLRLAGRGDVPVVTGLGQTLAGRDPGPIISSGDGFAPDAEPAGPGADSGAVEFLVTTIMAASTPVTLAAIGPLSNVGAALQREPRLAARLRALVVMGGRLGPEAHLGEHNVNSDPEATRLVLESGAPLRLGTYEVTVQARLGREDAERLRGSGDGACAAAAAMLDRYLDQTRRERTAMYDPLTLTLACDERFLQTRPANLQADYGNQLVRLASDDHGPIRASVSFTANTSAFLDYLLRTIMRA